MGRVSETMFGRVNGMTATIQIAEAVRQATVLRWIGEVRAAAHEAPWAHLLDFEGLDTIDVLLSPIHLTLLRAARQSPTPSAINRAIGQLREWGYRAKMTWRRRMAAFQSAPAEPADFLFWSRDITHTTTMEAVAAAAATRGDRCRLLACQPNIFAGLRRYVADPVYTVGAWPNVVRQARRDGARRARSLEAIGPWNVPAPPPGSPAAADEVLRRVVIDHLPLAAESIANAHAALDVFRPRVLVVGNDLTTEGRAGARVAAMRGVPTAMFMHGTIVGDALQPLHCADRVLVYADSHRRVLVDLGIPPERIVVCGAPHLDRRPQQTGEVHPKLRKRFKLRSEEPWILVATSGPGNRISHKHHLQVVGQLAELSRALPEVPMLVKLHRKDHRSYYDEAIKRAAPNRFFVVPDGTAGLPGDIFDWLQGCRLVLTGASTVAGEAMLMGVSVITMDFCGEIHGVEFIDAGATTHVTSGEALLQAVREILRRGMSDLQRARVQSYLEEAYSSQDGRAGYRGADALRALADAGCLAPKHANTAGGWIPWPARVSQL
jgi:hypothetical protein